MKITDLPHRLHDAEIAAISVDLEHRALTMDVWIWIGGADDFYRRATARISDLQSWSCDTLATFSIEGRLVVDDVHDTPDGHLRLFVSNWNAYLEFLGSTLNFEWTSDLVVGPNGEWAD